VPLRVAVLREFDPAQCKILMAQPHWRPMPEGWTSIRRPAPKFRMWQMRLTQMDYLNWVDQFNTLGLGRNVHLPLDQL